MEILSPRSVYAPGREPPKSEIIQLLDRIIQNTGVSVSRPLRSDLYAVTPAAGTFPRGEVLDDPNLAYNGIYAWSGSAWSFERTFPSSIARMTVIGGTANAVVAALDPAVSGAGVVAFIIKPTATNSGPVTVNGKSVINVNGNALAAGEFPAGRMIIFTEEGLNYQLVSDPNADVLLQAAIDLVDDATQLATPADATVSIAKLDAALAATVPVLSKTSPFVPAILRTGVGAASIRAGTVAKVGTALIRFTAETAVTMPTLTAGTDYAVFISSAGGAQAVAWTANTGADPTPPGGTWAWIGGFHYAPGSNATAWNTGGDRAAQINAYSIWDLKFRPTCRDPRGMALVAGKFWADIYLLGVNHHLNGTSRNNVAIATGTAKPKTPMIFGGDGTTLVTQQDWMWTAEIYDSHAKRYMNYSEARTAFFGVVEEYARSAAPVTTGLNTTNTTDGTNNRDERFTSIWGLNLSTGSYYVWGQDLMYGTFEGNFSPAPGSSAATVLPDYYAVSNGRTRGTTPQEKTYATRGGLYGGKFGLSSSGSGSADWANGIQTFSSAISGRGAADHLVLF